MSICTHDQTCPGYGARHDLRIPAGMLPAIDHKPMSDARVKRLRRSIIKAHRDLGPAKAVGK